jgi:hypothetical protein
MTNIEAKEKAIEIADSYWDIVKDMNISDEGKCNSISIRCAINQVKANIELLKEVRYHSKRQDYEQILSQLEQM